LQRSKVEAFVVAMAAGERGQYTCKTACHYDRGGYKTG
jgi:hypothetical protein